MKLFGNSRYGAHIEGKAAVPAPVKKTKKGRKLKIALLIVVIILALAASAVAVYFKFYVKPPDVPSKRPTPVEPVDTTPDKTPTTVKPVDKEPAEEKPRGTYTFLLLGTDDGNGNTDTIMAATFDCDEYTLDVVSIPRDTLVNVSWSVKKANTLYAYKGIDGMMESFGDLMGFVPDFYVMVDLEAFAALVDAIGGVEYDVPVSMYYNDPAQDLYINIPKGLQLLDGEDALKVVRFRSGYATADIGRIDTQQDFLKTAAEQILANTDSLKLTELAEIFFKYVETDLTYGNLIWMGQEFFKMDAENINFHTLPANYWDSVGGASYVTIYPNEWLELINTSLNPYDEPIELSDLSILTRNASGYIYSTDGVYAGNPSWGAYTPPADTGDDEDEEDPEQPEDPDDPGNNDTPTPEDPTDTPTPPDDPTTGDPTVPPETQDPIVPPETETPVNPPITDTPVTDTPTDTPIA